MLISGPVFANTIWDIYGGLSFGVGAQTFFINNNNETRSAQSFGALFGIDLPVFRLEAEYNYLNSSDSHTNIAFANAYFKVPSTVVKPYLGVGIGIEFDGKNDKNTTDFDTSAAYQGIFGATIDTPALPIKFDIEGRAIYIPDICEIGGASPDLLHYEGRVKIRYVF
jgi:hypothetical protein